MGALLRHHLQLRLQPLHLHVSQWVAVQRCCRCWGDKIRREKSNFSTQTALEHRCQTRQQLLMPQLITCHHLEVDRARRICRVTLSLIHICGDKYNATTDDATCYSTLATCTTSLQLQNNAAFLYLTHHNDIASFETQMSVSAFVIMATNHTLPERRRCISSESRFGLQFCGG